MENSPKKPKGFSFRQVAVLIEDLRSQFRVFGERTDIFDRKLEDVRTNQARTLERVTMIELSQRKILGKLEVHDDLLSRLE